MARRPHIIYAHPADSDGFAFLYLCYYPGGEHVILRFGETPEQREELAMTPVQMLDWLDARRQSAVAADQPSKPWDHAAKALRARLRQWLQRAEER